MKIFRNFTGKEVHTLDRPPETQEELNYLAHMFPSCVLKRKTNGKAIYIRDAKIKNIKWYV